MGKRIRQIRPDQDHLAIKLFTSQISISQRSVDVFFEWLSNLDTTPNKPNEDNPLTHSTKTQSWLKKHLPWLFGKN